MRTVYIGTSDFAATVLERLAGSPHRPTLVVTRPDSRQGRGRRLTPPPVAHRARSLGLELVQPPSVNDEEASAAIAAARPEVVCVCAYGGLIREPLLSAHPMLNVHPSLLPRWRGAAPIERAIMAGDESTGVTIMRLTAGLDSGPILLQEAEPIRAEDTYGTLASRLSRLGGELLVRTLDSRPAAVDQPEEGVTYAEKITGEDRRLDPARAAAELERIVRALTPHVGAWLELRDGTRLGITQARTLEQDVASPGELAVGAGEVPVLGCGAGALELVRVKPPGRREMSGAEWLRGHRR